MLASYTPRVELRAQNLDGSWINKGTGHVSIQYLSSDLVISQFVRDRAMNPRLQKDLVCIANIFFTFGIPLTLNKTKIKYYFCEFPHRPKKMSHAKNIPRDLWRQIGKKAIAQREKE